MRDRLTEGQRGYVIEDGRKKRGAVKVAQPKGYLFHVDGEEEARHFSEKKVKADRPAKAKRPARAPAAASLKIDGPALAPRQVRVEVGTRALARPEAPAESEAYLAWVRLGECINPGCHNGPPCDPHHEDAKLVQKGVSQTAPDHMTVSLCRTCHTVYTGIPGKRGGCLPDPEATRQEKRLILRSREETLAILRRALDERMTRALALLPQAWRVRVAARALAMVPEAELRAALLGERGDETTTTGAT